MVNVIICLVYFIVISNGVDIRELNPHTQTIVSGTSTNRRGSAMNHLCFDFTAFTAALTELRETIDYFPKVKVTRADHRLVDI